MKEAAGVSGLTEDKRHEAKAVGGFQPDVGELRTCNNGGFATEKLPDAFS